MSTQQHYDAWSAQYDTNLNKTRDLEAVAIRQMLGHHAYSRVLEIGCGTGKNTLWLAESAQYLCGVDLSGEMLAQAISKVEGAHFPASKTIRFQQADITQPWEFGEGYDLVSFSLMLEHIAELVPVFAEAARALVRGGFLYLGELHPIKQYLGSKAKYIADGTEIIVDCYTHHTSDFVQAATLHGLQIIDLQEFFDADDRSHPPRVLGMVFQKM